MINEKYAKSYCKDDISLIENYELAVNSSEKWEVHHRLEMNGNKRIKSKKQLIDDGLYYNRPADELIFMTKSDHMRLHNSGKNSSFYGKDRNGSKNPFYGRTGQKNPMSKTVLQFDKNNIFIRKWSCTKDIERELHIPHNHISYCCNGKLKSAGGYIWRYAE